MIPPNLHRTVPEQTTDEVEEWWLRAAALHPRWQCYTWRDPMPAELFPLTSTHWWRCATGAQRAGLIRLEVLWHHGGVYLDSDVEVFRPFDSLRQCAGFAAWEDASCVPDAVLGFKRGHPAVERMLALAIERIDQGAWASGPGVTTEVLPGRDDVLVLPPGAFFPYHYNEKHRRHEDFTGLPWVFCAHHWHGSWLPAKV